MTSDDRDAQASTVQLAGGPVEEYLAGVRAALADLPAPEVSEIVDDVRAHLADLAADLDGEPDLAAFTARLGTPAAYAAELRAAAGYPPAPAPVVQERRSTAAPRAALVGMLGSTFCIVVGALAGAAALVLLGVLVAALALPLAARDGAQVPRVAALPEVRGFVSARPADGTPARRVTDFVASLQPGWWAVRALAAAAVVLQVLGGGADEAVLLLALLAIPLSVWVGRRTRRDRRWLWVVVPLNGLAAVALLAFLDGSSWDTSSSAQYVSAPRPGLWQDSEREIRDIRPVDSAGNPLTGVYLFDQDGRPIDASSSWGCELDRPSRAASGGGSGGRSDDGSDIDASPYPRGTVDVDPTTGQCVRTPPGPLVVALPSATPTPAPTGVPATGYPATGVPTPVPPTLVPPTPGTPTVGPPGQPSAPPGVPQASPVPAPPGPPTRPAPPAPPVPTG